MILYSSLNRGIASVFVLLVGVIALSGCGSSTSDPTPANVFAGTYKGELNGKASAKGGSFTTNVTQLTFVFAAGSSANQLTWVVKSQLGSSGSWTASSNGNQLTIPKQTGIDLFGNTATYAGTGSLTGNQLTMTLDVKDPDDPTATGTYIFTASK